MREACGGLQATPAVADICKRPAPASPPPFRRPPCGQCRARRPIYNLTQGDRGRPDRHVRGREGERWRRSAHARAAFCPAAPRAGREGERWRRSAHTVPDGHRTACAPWRPGQELAGRTQCRARAGQWRPPCQIRPPWPDRGNAESPLPPRRTVAGGAYAAQAYARPWLRAWAVQDAALGENRAVLPACRRAPPSAAGPTPRP